MRSCGRMGRIASTFIIVLLIIACASFLYLVSSFNRMMEDRLVINCISGIDVLDKLQRDLCLDVMEAMDYHKKEDSRGDLYIALRDFNKGEKNEMS